MSLLLELPLQIPSNRIQAGFGSQKKEGAGTWSQAFQAWTVETGERMRQFA